MVYRVAYQFAGNHHDAEDIAQEVFIKVYRSLDRFRQDAQLTSWLYRIAMNACIDFRRRQSPATSRLLAKRRNGSFSIRPRSGQTRRTVPTPASSVRCSRLQSRGCRRASGSFIMRHHQGLKLSEIAEALGLAEGTVKRQLHAAVHRLRGALAHANVTVGERM